MDDADRAARSDEWIMRAAIEERKPEGPSPMLVTMCLFCGKAIERVSATDVKAGKMVKRWCCADCRNAWSKENE
jgi:hypothetical protein